MSSVRNRLFVLVAGTALLASVAIGVVHLGTETERLGAVADTGAVADLYNMTVLLSNAIRDQDEAVGDYLLTSQPIAATRYGYAVESELWRKLRTSGSPSSDRGMASARRSLRVRPPAS
jgi:hypothetical protein